jgi:hypothetical protein
MGGVLLPAISSPRRRLRTMPAKKKGKKSSSKKGKK